MIYQEVNCLKIIWIHIGDWDSDLHASGSEVDDAVDTTSDSKIYYLKNVGNNLYELHENQEKNKTDLLEQKYSSRIYTNS